MHMKVYTVNVKMKLGALGSNKYLWFIMYIPLLTSDKDTYSCPG